MEKDAIDHVYKVLLVGDGGVGKTSLLLKFTEGSFTQTGAPSGVTCKYKIITVDGKVVKLWVWDNIEQTDKLSSAPYEGMHGILYIYDATNLNSLENLVKWKKKIKLPKAAGLYIGTKTDLAREGERDKAKARADKAGLPCIETSSKTGDNVEESFESDTIVRLIIEQSHTNEGRRKKKNEKSNNRRCHVM